MFRKSRSSTISSLSSSTSSCMSSYSSGTASIIVHQQPIIIETPPRTTSLNFRQLIQQSSPSSFLSLFEDEFEDIDLAEDTSPCGSSSCGRASSTKDVTIDNMSSVIAAAIQLSTSGGKNPSSLSSRNASIIRHKSTTNTCKKKENRFSKNLFNRWSIGSSKKSSERSSTISIQQLQKLKIQFDDGKEELIYRGIRVKEIRSALDPIVVPTYMSVPSLQRPEFAGLSY